MSRGDSLTTGRGGSYGGAVVFEPPPRFFHQTLKVVNIPQGESRRCEKSRRNIRKLDKADLFSSPVKTVRWDGIVCFPRHALQNPAIASLSSNRRSNPWFMELTTRVPMSPEQKLIPLPGRIPGPRGRFWKCSVYKIRGVGGRDKANIRQWKGSTKVQWWWGNCIAVNNFRGV